MGTNAPSFTETTSDYFGGISTLSVIRFSTHGVSLQFLDTWSFIQIFPESDMTNHE